MTLFKKFATPLIAVALVAVMGVSLLTNQRTVYAVVQGGVTVGTATANLSTNAGTGITPTWQTISNVVWVEAATGEISVAVNAYTIAPPAGWVFNTASVVTHTGGGADITARSVTSVAANLITLSVTAGAGGTTDTMTVGGIQARPTSAATAAGAANGVFAVTAGAITGLATLNAVTLTTTFDAANYVAGGSTAGATSTLSAVGGTVVQVTSQGAGVTSATLQASAGVWAASNSATTFCNDQNTSCDVISGTANVIQAALILPASGTVTVTVTPNTGTASTITITTTAAPVLTSLAITTTGTVSVDAAGTSNGGGITFQLRDQTGAAFTGAGTTTISTTLGVIDDNGDTGATCDTSTPDAPATAGSDASCTVANTGALLTIGVTGNGIAGVATVTFTATIGGATVSATKAVTISGTVNTLAIKFQSTNTSAGAFVDGATPLAAATGASFRASITALDSAGVRVSGITAAGAVATFDPVGCAAADTIGDATSTATVDVLKGIDPALAAGTTCTVTVTNNAKTASATFTVGGALASTNVVTVTAADVATAATSTVTVTVKNSAGVNIGDNTPVTLVVTGGAVIDATAETINGVATFTYVSPGTAQTVNLTAVAGTLNASKSINVGTVVTPPPATGFSGATIATTGLTIVSASGTIANLDATAAANTPKIVSFTATVGGNLITYLVGAPAFVNTAFTGAFPTGLSNTFVFVKTGA